MQSRASQRDHLVRDLYAILFAFVVETANHKIAPNLKDPALLFDQAGYQTKGTTGTGSTLLPGSIPLVPALGQSGFDEFCINFRMSSCTRLSSVTRSKMQLGTTTI
jgi:chitin synthase